MLLFSAPLTRCADLAAQEMLSDNLGILDPWLPNTWGWVDAGASHNRYAQQFLIDGHTSIDQVTLELIQTGPNARGSVSCELWNDTGNNHPDAKVADLGETPEVTQMSGIRTNYTFDRLITGLQPDDKYWVVLNYSGMISPSFFNSVGWAVIFAPPPPPPPTPCPGLDESHGTNGAACGHVIK